MENFFLEKYQLKTVQLPHDANTVVAGARIPMGKAKRIVFILHMGDGSAGTVTPSFIQSDAASAGNSKALTIDNPYYHQVAAATKFTKVQPPAKASSFDISALFVADEGIAVFEVLAEDLDVSNDFAWVALDLADVTATKLIGVMALIEGGPAPAYAQNV